MSEKIMDKIAALINQAESVGLDSPEGKAFWEKASQLMDVHRLEEAAVRARQMAKGIGEPKKHLPTDITIEFVGPADAFLEAHMDVVSAIARFTGVRIVYKDFRTKMHVIGFPDDIDYFRMLWLSAHLTFSGKLFPEWNKSASAGENIRLFAEAGYKWLYIWEKARKVGQPLTHEKSGAEIPAPPADNGWMKRQLAKAYKATGEEKPKLTHAVGNYRDSYAMGFVTAFRDRIWDLQMQRERRERQADNGVALVLASDVNSLDDYFNSLYPPGSLGYGGAGRSLSGNHSGAMAAGKSAASMVDMSGGRGGVSGAGPRGAIG